MPDASYESEPTHESDAADAYTAGDAQQPTQQAVPASRVVYCTSCGVQLDGLRIGEPCPNCGVPVGSAAQAGPKTNGKAVASLVLGICSFVGCLLYGLPGIVCGILAIVFAGKVRRGVASGDIPAASMGLANAGRICGIIGLCLSILYALVSIAWLVVFFGFMMPQQQMKMQQMQNQMQQTHPAPLQPAPAQPSYAPQPETPPSNP